MKKYASVFLLTIMVAPLAAMETSESEGLKLEQRELEDIEELERGTQGVDRHHELALRARNNKLTKKRKNRPIEDELSALEAGSLGDINPRLTYVTAICDREGVDGKGRDKIVELVQNMSDDEFATFQETMGRSKKGKADDKKFNLLLEMLVKAQEDSSVEMREQLAESKRQFAIEQRRADDNRRRAIIAGFIGGTGTVIASIIAIAKYVQDGGC